MEGVRGSECEGQGSECEGRGRECEGRGRECQGRREGVRGAREGVQGGREGALYAAVGLEEGFGPRCSAGVSHSWPHAHPGAPRTRQGPLQQGRANDPSAALGTAPTQAQPILHPHRPTPATCSTKDLSLGFFDEGEDLTGPELVFTGGYGQLVTYLYNQVTAKGGKVELNKPVTAVKYSRKDGVEVRTHALAIVVVTAGLLLGGGFGFNRAACLLAMLTRLTACPTCVRCLSLPAQITAGGASYKADFTVITVPAGVLKAEKIAFTPALPAAKRKALSVVGMGVLNKVMLEMPSSSAGWGDVNWFERIPLAEDAGKWREFFSFKKSAGRDVMVAFNAGDAAKFPKTTSDASLVSEAVKVLTAMFPAFGPAPAENQTWVTRWHDDEWSYGSYSYLRVGANARTRKAVAAKVKNLLYFAGEHTSVDYPATVQGAYISGEDAAKAAIDYWV
jgi:hypothetical protein